MRWKAHPLDAGVPPAWACEWGRDEHGVFAGFSVQCAIGDERVVQRMRWIPPGRFVMGSPDGEAGRWEDEGPQHEVTITRGYWLADTPCTQALWQAVMGSNPSRFVSPQRPVEQVSWDDCQDFLRRLAERTPTSATEPLRLPTEAEWEYACRAGTTTATWVGDLTLRGERDAPELDAIAWYGGNSGVGFELSDGHDSSDWPEKQHPHEQAGTRVVRGRAPNPWGQHDVLGNVWEWCSDWFGSYPSTPSVDPEGARTGSSRVLRGGSWYDRARYVRAATRDANEPGNRYANIGFRLARGHSA